ncbi:MAG: response regulator [candidate division NC10 bacterium]|nr:response regulator [candidate division NC10 bacterium]
MADDQATGTGGLRRRLTLAFLLVGLLPAAVAGVLGVRQSLHAAQAARLESEERLVALSAEAVAATLRNGLHILRAAGGEDDLRRAVLAGDRTRLAREVRSLHDHSPAFASVLVLDATGIALANSLDPAVVGRAFRDRDYYQGVLRSRAPYISPVPYVGAATRVPTLAIAAPIWASRREFIGVVAATFTLERLSQLLAPASVVAAGGANRGGDQGEVYLVSPSGVVLAHTDPSKRATTVAASDAGAREALAGRRGSVTWTDESEGVRLGVFAPLPEIGWGLVYTRPYHPILFAMPYLFPGILPALIVVLAAAALAGTLAARQLSRPILNLQRAVARLREGDFGARLPEDRRDELGDLAAGFNRMATALQDLYTNMENKVAERTATLKTTNLELARASQVKSEFLARMSHDLRTSLNAILGFTELLLTQEADPLTDKQQRYLAHVANAGQHLLGLINDILDLSRVEAGRLEIHPEPCQVAPLLEGTLALFRTQALARRITLTLEIVSPLGELMADRIRLQQILHNLLSNAVKFSPEGGVVTVTARQIGLELELVVQDRGIGIHPEDQERIFEMYEQAGTAEGRQKGTGLGLAITKRLVELHGGRIQVASAPGQGSTFTVRLPGMAPTGAERADADAPRPLVLVVEDDLQSAELIRDHLTQGGYRVVVVGSGHAGLGAARRLRPHAITLDLGLPDMDGWEILYRLKRDPDTQAIPVLIVSARDQGRLGLSLGAVDWLVKPVDPKRLFAALQRCRELGTPRRTFRILVVDDEPVVLEALEALLTREGHEVLQASDGEAALRQAETARPDIILLDLHLPGLSGFEVVGRLRQIAGLEAIPIIAFSGKFVSPEERTLLTQQAVQFVGKYGAVAVNRLLDDLRQISSLAN